MSVGSTLVLESFLLKKIFKDLVRGLSFLSVKMMRVAKNSKRKNLAAGMLHRVRGLRLR